MSSTSVTYVRDAAVRFIALAFAVSWLAGVAVAAVLQAVLPDSLDRVSLLVAKFGPSIAGLVMAYTVAGSDGFRSLLRAAFRLRAPWWGYAFVLLVPPALLGGALALHGATGGSVDWGAVRGIGGAEVLLALATFVFLGGGLGEELGWRGFLLPQLQRAMTPRRATLILGVAWAVWHYPALLLDTDPGTTPLWLFTAFVLAVSVLFTWLFNATHGNVWLAVLLHAAVNACERLAEGVVPAAEERTVEMWMVGLYAVAAAYFVTRLGGRQPKDSRCVSPSSEESENGTNA